jgi:uncharacterized protein YndB with AHSA1/START domain
MKIHHEVTFAAAPDAVYRALADAAEHARFTGAPAEISGDVGGTFAVYGGHISGRNLALVPGQRIVQAWRAKTWEPDVYSIARFDLRPEGAATRLVFDQEGVPDDVAEHIDGGWKAQYWEKLRAYLEK